jgi:adenylate cyclase
VSIRGEQSDKSAESVLEVWSSSPGTGLLYGAFAIHFVLAHWSVYERRTFRPPPLELLRTALTSPCRSC